MSSLSSTKSPVGLAVVRGNIREVFSGRVLNLLPLLD
jgi:hypothetical protein